MASIESAAQLHIVLLPFLVRCAAAALCGAMIGIERELKGKPAGLRTNMLICVGACMYMLIGLMMVHGAGESTDSGRIAAQVVTGIGFLGAGAIIQSGGHVTGLTSAATIWIVAAIGLVAGAGFPILAVVAALAVVGTLVLLRGIERKYLDPAHPDDQFPGAGGL